MQVGDVESGQPPGGVIPNFKGRSFKLQHPVVAYLSHLREPRSRAEDGGKSSGPKRRPSLLPRGLLGRSERRGSHGASIQSSMMSETQRSLASLESMISGTSRQVRGLVSRRASFLWHVSAGAMVGRQLYLPETRRSQSEAAR